MPRMINIVIGTFKHTTNNEDLAVTSLCMSGLKINVDRGWTQQSVNDKQQVFALSHDDVF